MTELTRRRLLAAAGGVAAGGLFAGCTGSTAASETDAPTAAASFFVFGDVAAEVTGDAAETELLVPLGQHGHGWEPGPRVRETIRSAALFAHGMDGFQPWVDDVRRDLAADGAAVETLDVSAGLDLLDVGDAHDEGTETHHDEGTHTETGHHDGEDEHGDEGADPHFWMDPLRVKDAVETVEQGLAGVDEANADAFAANADEYRTTLDELHDRIETVVADGTNDVLLVAGHDSFRYLGDRYGLQVEALTSVSPDDRPTTRDIERAQELVAEHDLRYVCADPLESQQAADQLVEETDAEAVLPLTAMPGLTDEWAEEDWGYVEVMENVNLPSLGRVLAGR